MASSRKVGGMLEYLQSLATRLLMEEDGQGTTEYGLVLVLVSIVAIALLQVIGVKVTGLLNVWP
jgi:Flp pilus assembly pilin Flp